MVVRISDPEAEKDARADGNEDTTSHDLIFKTVFHHFFADLVEIAEPELAKRLDLSEVEFLEQEAFSDFPAGERAIADLVAKTWTRDGEGRIVLIQVEVEGEFRTSMDERTFFYYMHLRIKYRLPLVTIVVFLKGGSTSIEVREFVDQVENMKVCVFRYVAFSLAPSQAESFLDRPQPLAPALASLMRSDWDPVEKKLRCLRAIGRAKVDEARRFLLARVVDVYVELDEADSERFAIEVRQEEEVHKMVITWEDALAASKAEGEATGALMALRNGVLRVLKQRFSSVPPAVPKKLEAISNVGRLEEILDQAVQVNSVDELVLEP